MVRRFGFALIFRITPRKSALGSYTAIEMAFLAAKLIVDNSIFSTDLYILPFKQNYSVGFPDDTF
jgi:hypothetical protein